MTILMFLVKSSLRFDFFFLLMWAPTHSYYFFIIAFFSFFVFRFMFCFFFLVQISIFFFFSLFGFRFSYFNERYFWILSSSTCSVHFAHQIDLKKRDSDGFFVEKKNLFWLKFKKVINNYNFITLSKRFFAAALVHKQI